MRTIKFRGKRNKDGEWIYGLLTNDTKGHYRINFNPICFSSIVKSETVGQFTGFTDKSNKEIYEGDVLNNGQRNYIVCWNNERGAWWLKNKDLIYTTPLGFLSMELFVIGTVYDSPELINH